MNEKLIVYLDIDSFEEIILFDDIYPNLNRIFGSKNCQFYIDINENDLDSLLADSESNLSLFLNGNNLPEPIAAKNDFESFYANGTIQIHNGRVFYIIQKGSEEVKQIEYSHGIIVNSNKNINDNVFNFKFQRGFDKNENISGNSHGWNNLLKDLVFPPSNSLIISDNHLFDNIHNKNNVGLYNVLNLLDVVLPSQLSVDYHLFLISSAPKVSTQKADELVKSINDYILSKNLGYQVFLKVVFANAIHKRIIISNYYIIVCDKGFKLFYPNKSTIFDDNDIAINSIFEDTEFRGESNLQISNRRIKNIKKIYDEVKAQVDGGIIDTNKRIISYPVGNKELNRLFL